MLRSLVGSEMCIRDRFNITSDVVHRFSRGSTTHDFVVVSDDSGRSRIEDDVFYATSSTARPRPEGDGRNNFTGWQRVLTPLHTPPYTGATDFGYELMILAPDPPTDVTAVPGLAVTAVSWTAPASGTPAASYNIRWRQQGTVDYTTFRNNPSTAYNIAGLQPSTTYEVQVQSEAADGGTSDWTAAITFRVPDPPRPPASPQNIVIRPNENGFILNWDAPPDTQDHDPATSYVIYTQRVPDNRVHIIFDILTTFGAVQDLEYNTNYLMTVVAVNDFGDSGYRNFQVVRTAAAPLPSVPEGLSLTTFDNEITARWQPLLQAESYDVRYRIEGTVILSLIHI